MPASRGVSLSVTSPTTSTLGSSSGVDDDDVALGADQVFGRRPAGHAQSRDDDVAPASPAGLRAGQLLEVLEPLVWAGDQEDGVLVDDAIRGGVRGGLPAEPGADDVGPGDAVDAAVGDRTALHGRAAVDDELGDVEVRADLDGAGEIGRDRVRRLRGQAPAERPPWRDHVVRAGVAVVVGDVVVLDAAEHLAPVRTALGREDDAGVGLVVHAGNDSPSLGDVGRAVGRLALGVAVDDVATRVVQVPCEVHVGLEDDVGVVPGGQLHDEGLAGGRPADDDVVGPVGRRGRRGRQRPLDERDHGRRQRAEGERDAGQLHHHDQQERDGVRPQVGLLAVAGRGERLDDDRQRLEERHRLPPRTPISSRRTPARTPS